MAESISHKMAQFALNLRYEDIPAEAVKEAKRFMIDSIGCALAAVPLEDMQKAHRYIEDLGGAPQATVIGTGHRTNMANAALMNALLIRAMDYNDIYWKQDPSHPSDIIPAALNPGEFKGINGRELIVAIMIAYELEMRWCLAAFPGVREIGWHHASLTQFVSPLVAGRVLGLNEDQMVAAMGISGSSHFTLGGVVAGHLTNMKNTADPMSTEAGVRAAMLAAHNYSGPVELVEGKEGVMEVINAVRFDLDILLDGLGKKFLITECGYKAFPTEALTHQPITAVLDLMHEHGLTGDDISEVEIQTTTRGADILSDPSKYDPQTKETADHSLPYCIAVALSKSNVLPGHFDDVTLWDNHVRAQLSKIKVVANPEIDGLFPKVKRAIATISTTDGRSFTRQEDFAKGRAENPLSDEELVAKYKSNGSATLSDSQLDAIVDATWKLDEYDNIADYVKLLVKEQ